MMTSLLSILLGVPPEGTDTPPPTKGFKKYSYSEIYINVGTAFLQAAGREKVRVILWFIHPF